MRYMLAGVAASIGAVLLGLAAHDTVIPAWQVITGTRQPVPVNSQNASAGSTTPGK